MSSYYVDKINISKSLMTGMVNVAGTPRVLMFCDNNIVQNIDCIITYSPSALDISAIASSNYDDKAIATDNPFVLYFSKNVSMPNLKSFSIIIGYDANKNPIYAPQDIPLTFNDSSIIIQYEHKDSPSYIVIENATLISITNSIDSSNSKVMSKNYFIIAAKKISSLIPGKSVPYYNYIVAENTPIPNIRTY